MKESAVAFEVTSPHGFQKTVTRCRAALADEGFGVLTEIDLRAKLKEKLDVDIPPQLILGACHPPSAYRALLAAPEVAVLLPCNVVVAEENDTVVVRAMNPQGALQMIPSAALAAVALEVGAALRRVLLNVSG